jgi:hypothetical protein
MRVVLVWPGPDLLAKISVRFEHYLLGFSNLGHEAFAVAPRAQLEGFTTQAYACETLDDLRNPSFWRVLNPDIAVVITWLGHTEILQALRPSCKYIVSIADSDGQVGARAHPGATLCRMVGQHQSLLNKIRATKFWLQQYLYLWKTLDQQKIASISASDIVVVCNSVAKTHLLRFLDCHKADEQLKDKIVIAPYPVASCFLNDNIPRQRKDRIVAIGRWESPQKDAPLLAKVLTHVLHARPHTEAYVLGSGGEVVFQSLRNTTRRFHYLGVKPPTEAAQILAESRCLLLTSRWESGPIVANEALCMGCSLVGPKCISSLSSYCGAGPFGTVSNSRSAEDLAGCLVKELQAWDQGLRDPVASATYWRPHFDPVNVCTTVLKESLLRSCYHVRG